MKNSITFASSNDGKFNLMRKVMQKYQVDIIQLPLHLPNPCSSSIKEAVTTKCNAAFDQMQQAVLVTQTAFYIYALNGFPNTHAEYVLQSIGIEGILKLVHGKDRSCELIECIAYKEDKNSSVKLFIGHKKGQIAPTPKGNMQNHLSSNIAQLFIPEFHYQTLAEMTYLEYLDWHQQMEDVNFPERMFSKWWVNLKRQVSY